MYQISYRHVFFSLIHTPMGCFGGPTGRPMLPWGCGQTQTVRGLPKRGPRNGRARHEREKKRTSRKVLKTTEKVWPSKKGHLSPLEKVQDAPRASRTSSNRAVPQIHWQSGMVASALSEPHVRLRPIWTKDPKKTRLSFVAPWRMGNLKRESRRLKALT